MFAARAQHGGPHRMLLDVACEGLARDVPEVHCARRRMWWRRTLRWRKRSARWWWWRRWPLMLVSSLWVRRGTQPSMACRMSNSRPGLKVDVALKTVQKIRRLTRANDNSRGIRFLSSYGRADPICATNRENHQDPDMCAISRTSMYVLGAIERERALLTFSSEPGFEQATGRPVGQGRAEGGARSPRERSRGQDNVTP